MMVSGRVTADDDRATPLANARITLTSDVAGREPLVVLSDSDGAFSVRMAGKTIAVAVTRTGFSPARALATAGEPLGIRLARGAVISGRLVDQEGRPLEGQRVSAERLDGDSPFTVSTTADDRGEYRLSGLTRGRYRVVSVMPVALFVTSSFSIPEPTRVYYPGSSDADGAEPLDMAAGDERTDIDLVLSLSDNERSSLSSGFVAPPMPALGAPVSGAEGAAVRGRVVDGAGQPVTDATVFLRGRNLARRTVSGRDGEYAFIDLPLASVDIFAEKHGHSLLPQGPQLRPGASVTLAAGRTAEGVDLLLAPWSSVTGRVVDEYGEPVQGARVQLMTSRYERGRQRLVGAGAAIRTTNDLGIYRLWNVTPGRYLVSATVGEVLSAELPGYGRSYYPGTDDPAAASPVTIATSQEVTGVDLILTRQPTANISGRLLDAEGRPTNGGSLTLLPSARSASPLGIGIGARIEKDGSFEFANVTPGAYVIQSNAGQSGGSRLPEFGVLRVNVTNDDVRDLMLRRSRGATLTGHVSVSPGAITVADASFTGTQVTTMAADPDFDLPNSNRGSQVDAAAGFTLRGLVGPRRLRVDLPDGWVVEQINIGGVDITDRIVDFDSQASFDDVEVTVTDRISILRGSVSSRDGRTLSRQSLVVFSNLPDQWYPGSRFVRRTRSDVDGSYAVKGLPLGTYYIAPLEVEPGAALADAAFLDSLIPQALSVSVTEGQTTIAHVRAGPR